MRRIIPAVFIVACAIVLFPSCSSSPSSRKAKSMTWSHFPVTVVSGNVRVSVSASVETDNRLYDLSVWVPDRDAARRTAQRVAEYNSQVEPMTLTQTFSECVEKNAGDTIVYAFRKGETSSVSVTALEGEAIIECSGVEYRLTEKKPGVTLFFRN